MPFCRPAATAEPRSNLGMPSDNVPVPIKSAGKRVNRPFVGSMKSENVTVPVAPPAAPKTKLNGMADEEDVRPCWVATMVRIDPAVADEVMFAIFKPPVTGTPVVITLTLCPEALVPKLAVTPACGCVVVSAIAVPVAADPVNASMDNVGAACAAPAEMARVVRPHAAFSEILLISAHQWFVGVVANGVPHKKCLFLNVLSAVPTIVASTCKVFRHAFWAGRQPATAFSETDAWFCYVFCGTNVTE